MPEIVVNRAPFLTLWATVVAERLGYPPDTALTLGRAVAGQTAHAKGRRLGILESRTESEREHLQMLRREAGAETLTFMGRAIPCLHTPQGVRALAETAPTDPGSVRRYLAGKFKDDLGLVRGKLEALAQSYAPDELEARAMDLYMTMRPATAAGSAGWGQAGRLDLEAIDRLVSRGA